MAGLCARCSGTGVLYRPAAGNTHATRYVRCSTCCGRGAKGRITFGPARFQ